MRKKKRKSQVEKKREPSKEGTGNQGTKPGAKLEK
jgi:hypothetical protein